MSFISQYDPAIAVLPIHAHRAPDPVPDEEPLPDPFEPSDPHQAPIRTPMNDEPVPDHNPSILRAAALH